MHKRSVPCARVPCRMDFVPRYHKLTDQWQAYIYSRVPVCVNCSGYG